MGQFKPMVKMETTEPSVELKLKKGGKVEKKMQMGGMPAGVPAMPMRTTGAPRGGALAGMPPKKPSLAMRRRAMQAMPSAAAPAGPVGMAGRMMKEGGESKAEHAAEMKKMAKTSEALKEHADKPASKAHKGLKTGGVVNGQGGYKKGGKVKMAGGGYCAEGGIINTEGQGGKYRDTKMDTTHPDHSPAKTGDVKMGNAGGYKKGGKACYKEGGHVMNYVEGNVVGTPAGKSNTTTGGVKKGNGGGYKKGGSAKKFADGGMSGYAPVSEEERQLAAEVLGPGFMSDEERHYYEQELMKANKPQGAVTEVEREVVRKIPMKRPSPQIKGPARKYAQGGSVNDSGKAEKMPARKVPTPVSINQLSGTYKKGGKVKK